MQTADYMTAYFNALFAALLFVFFDATDAPHKLMFLHNAGYYFTIRKIMERNMLEHQNINDHMCCSVPEPSSTSLPSPNFELLLMLHKY